MDCPSRFGYLRTLYQRTVRRAQADAYASLWIGCIIQHSYYRSLRRSPSTLHFALHHPERVTAVIMIAAKSQTPPRETFLQKIVFTTIFRSDFVYWAITKYLRSFLLSMFGVSSDVQAGFTPVDSAFVSDFISSMHPMSLRKAGIYNDREYLSTPSLDEYPLSSIAIPVLVIHAEDDALQPFTHGAHTAQNIPGARLVKFESGGHLLTGHIEEVKGELRRFIDKHAAAFAHAGPSETSGPSPEQGS